MPTFFDLLILYGLWAVKPNRLCVNSKRPFVGVVEASVAKCLCWILGVVYEYTDVVAALG